MAVVTEVVGEGQFRDYLMEERRILRDRLATLERQLGIEGKERALHAQIDDLKQRLRINEASSPTVAPAIANGSTSVLR